MWKGLQNGWEPPEVVTKDQYYYVKEHKDENPALTGFVGFGCSFGGKWFGGLAANKRGDNFCSNARNSLMRDLKYLKDTTFLNIDYKEVPVPDGSVVYCDPPYIDTTKYTTGNFNHKEFWEYMRELSQRCTVFISEQTAPEDFEAIWQQEVKRTLDYNKDNNFNKTEKLFVYKD